MPTRSDRTPRQRALPVSRTEAAGVGAPTYFFDTTPVKNRIYARVLTLPKLVYGILGVLVFMAAVVVAITVGQIAVAWATAGIKDAALVEAIPKVLGFGLMWAGFLIYARKAGFRAVGFGHGGGAKKIVLGLVGGLVLAVAVILPGLLIPGTSFTFNGAAFTTPTFWTGAAITFVTVIIQGGAEELVFRSMLPKFLARKYGAIGIIVLSAIAFSLMHFTPALKNPTVFLYTAALGLFFVVLAFATRSLWVVAALHAAYNFGVGYLTEQVIVAPEINILVVQLVTTGVGILAAVIVLIVLRVKRPGWQHERLTIDQAPTEPVDAEPSADAQPA